MKRPLLAFAVLAALSIPLSAQVKVQIADAASTTNGVVLVRSDNSTVIKSLPAPTSSSYRYVTYYEQNPYVYMGTYVTQPYSYSNYVYNRFGVSTRAYAKKGSNHKSLYMTGDAQGTSKVQKYVVTLSSPTATQVKLDLSVYGYLYDNAKAGFKLTDGSAINENYAWTQSGYNNVTKSLQLNLAANTPVTLNLEATGEVTPGAGTGYYDGYYASLYCNVLEIGNGSATLFGTGCGTATMVSGGTPVKGSYYDFGLKGGPASGAASFLYGTSKDVFAGFIQLPLALDYMGAKGCSLYVGFSYPWARALDAKGEATVRLYLSPYYSGKIFGQWVVFDAQANAAGVTLTQALEVKF